MRDPDCVLCGCLVDRGGRIDLGNGIAIAADAAPLLPGHALLHTLDHVPSFAAVQPEILRAAIDALCRLRDFGPYAHQDTFFFEHGTDGSSGGSGCVDHAHIHVLPLPTGFKMTMTIPEELALPGSRLPLDALSTLAGKSYFWIAGKELHPRIIHPYSHERQILRRIVAKMLHLPAHRTWDLYDLDSAKTTTMTMTTMFSKGIGPVDGS